MFGRSCRGLSEPPVDSSFVGEGENGGTAAMQARLNRLSATYGLSGSQNDLNLKNGPLQQQQQQLDEMMLLRGDERVANGNGYGHVRFIVKCK